MKKQTSTIQVLVLILKIVFVVFIVGFLTFLFEALSVFKGYDIWSALPGLVWFIISTLITAFFTVLVDQLYKKKTASKKSYANDAATMVNARTCENSQGEDMLVRACRFLRVLNNLFQKFRQSDLGSFIIMISFIFVISSFLAHNRVVGRTLDVFSEMRYSQSTETYEEQNAVSDLPADESSENIFTPDEHNKQSDKPIIKIPDTQEFLTDPSRYYQLTVDESNILYFRSGSYFISDWSDTHAVAQTLSQFISNQRNQQRSNIFDSEAPESVRGDVARVSELEINMANSDQLDQIIDVRLDTMNQYPKYALTKLLAANYQRYALEYYNIDGFYETIEYYYAQSLFWLFESLTFSDVDDCMTKSIITSIKMRYHDLAAITPIDSRNQQQAYILYEAFRILENNY